MVGEQRGNLTRIGTTWRENELPQPQQGKEIMNGTEIPLREKPNAIVTVLKDNNNDLIFLGGRGENHGKHEYIAFTRAFWQAVLPVHQAVLDSYHQRFVPLNTAMTEMFGGAIEQGDSPTQTLVKEGAEELGLQLSEEDAVLLPWVLPVAQWRADRKVAFTVLPYAITLSEEQIVQLQVQHQVVRVALENLYEYFLEGVNSGTLRPVTALVCQYILNHSERVFT